MENRSTLEPFTYTGGGPAFPCNKSVCLSQTVRVVLDNGRPVLTWDGMGEKRSYRTLRVNVVGKTDAKPLTAISLALHSHSLAGMQLPCV